MGTRARGGRETARRAVSAFETQGANSKPSKADRGDREAGSERGTAADTERAELLRQVAALNDQAHTATARASEIEKRAEDLKTALTTAQAAAQRATGGTRTERAQHGKTRDRMEATGTELVTIRRAPRRKRACRRNRHNVYSVRTPTHPGPDGSSYRTRRKPPAARQAEALRAQHAD